MIAAVVNWKLRSITSEDGFFQHFSELTERCASEGAQLVVMPECISLELLHLYPDAQQNEVAPLLSKHDYAELAVSLASKHNLLLVAGSTLRIVDNFAFNEAIIATPDGRLIRQTKNVLTQYEQAEWELSPGKGLNVLANWKVGVTICYDCEFPESGRALANAGAMVQCVPAFTESIRGFQRVRWCCMARATENQMFLLHASLVGSLGREPVPCAIGSSAILAPSAEPFPECSILAETSMNEEQVSLAQLDFQALVQARESNDVRNFNDRNRGNWSVSVL